MFGTIYYDKCPICDEAELEYDGEIYYDGEHLGSQWTCKNCGYCGYRVEEWEEEEW